MISKGDYIKGYIVEERLGGGGFGEVYLVNDGRDPTRKYAMKIIRSELTYDLGIRESFLNEMLNMARLSQHPNILSIINSLLFNDDEGERVGMVTEYLEGTSLGFYIHRYGPLEPSKAIPIFLQVLDAIGYAHKMGIIHRDIKPSNIMLEPEKTIKYREYSTYPVKVLDFGLSKALEGASAIESMSGATLSYAAPERFKKGAQIDLRSDVYSLGITLFEMLAGRPPFVIRSLSDAMEPAMGAVPPSITIVIPHCPSELDGIIRKSLARMPSDRYATCEEMANDLMALFPPEPKSLPPRAVENEQGREDRAAKSSTVSAGSSDMAPAGIQAEEGKPSPVSVAPQEPDAVKESEDEPDASSDAPDGTVGRTGPLPTVGALAAICLIVFMVFFFLKQGPEEPPPGQVEKLATQQEAGEETKEVQESVTPVPASSAQEQSRENEVTGGGAPTWRKTFGGTNDDEALCVRQTSDGAFIVSGWSKSFGKARREGWVIKLDAAGKEAWSKTYGGPGDYTAASIQETTDHGYIVAGSTGSGAASNAWVIKLDASGARTWSKTFGGAGEDDCTGILQTADGGYAFTGWTASFGKGKSDAWLVRLDPNGKEIWKKTYGTGDYNGANAIVQTDDGGYALAGVSVSGRSGQPDFWVVRTDRNGKEVWNKTFGQGVEGKGRTIFQTRDGGFLAAGEIRQKSGARANALVVKLDGNGKEVWSKTFGDDDDRATSVQETRDGGYIVAGYTPASAKTKSDIWLVRLDAGGNQIWLKTLSETQESKAYSVQQTLDGGYVLAGSTVSSGGGKRDALAIKLDGEGNLATGKSPSTGGQP